MTAKGKNMSHAMVAMIEPSDACIIYESSHGRGAAKFPEFLTCGAQYLIRNMISKKILRATPPTFPCASRKPLISSREELNRSETFEPKSAAPTVG